MKIYLIIAGMMLLSIYLGFLIGNEYALYKGKTIDGFKRDNVTMQEINSITEKYNPYGDWVCVDVRGMTFPRAYEVCVHECSHQVFDEIYAETCENNPKKCLELLEVLNEKDN